ncbi:MAG: methyltransferase family protein [Candidatus Rokuibacteriota bacterium]
MRYDYGLWGLAAIHVGWIMLFVLAFLRPGRRLEWRSLGMFSGFVVALYVEMYGFPLTIYLLTSVFGALPVPEPFAHAAGNLWGTLLLGPAAARPLMVLGDLFLLVGTLVLAIAWGMLYRARGGLVTRGPYAAVRHPQYSALALIILGALVQWPTLPTLLMAPVLIIAYVRLAWWEEREMEARFGEPYRAYRRRVPGFVPALPLPGVASRNRDSVASHKQA